MNIIKQMKDTAEKQERLRRRVDTLDVKNDNLRMQSDNLKQQVFRQNQIISEQDRTCENLRYAIYAIWAALFVIGCVLGTILVVLV